MTISDINGVVTEIGGWAAVTAVLGRVYYSVVNGGGLSGIWHSLMYGKSATEQSKQPTEVK